MSAPAFPHTIPLCPCVWTAMLESLGGLWRAWRLRWREHAEWRAAAAAQRELTQLDPRTLRDIGAPEGLIGQRHWQEELAALTQRRLLEFGRW